MYNVINVAVFPTVFQISVDGVFGPMLFKNNILKQRLTLSIKRLTFSQQAQSMETVGPHTVVIFDSVVKLC